MLLIIFIGSVICYEYISAQLHPMRILLVFFLISAFLTTTGQDFTPRQADSLKNVLATTHDDYTRAKTNIHLAEYYIWKKGEQAVDLDSAAACLSKADALNSTLLSTELSGYLLLIKGYMLTERGKRKEGQLSVEQSIPLLQKSNSQRLLGLAYFELQAFYDYMDSTQCRERTRLTELAVQAFHLAGDKMLEGSALTALGDLYTIQLDYAASNKQLLRAVDVYASIGHQKMQGVYELLGRNCNNQGDFRHAFEYALLALKAAKANHDSTMQMATIDNLVGALYRNAGRIEMSVDYFREGLEIALRHKDGTNAVVMMYVLGHTYLSLNEPAKAIAMLDAYPRELLDSANDRVNAITGMVAMKGYYELNQKKKAAYYAAKLEALVAAHTLSPDWANRVCLSLVSYHVHENNIAKARLYRDACMAIPLFSSSPEWIARYMVSYRVDSAEGNYRSAFYNLHKFKVEDDLLHNDIKTRQFQQLDVEYETSKKVDSIFLLTQKTHLQETNLHQAQMIRNITIVGIVLALAVLGLLYWQYRLKRETNKIMAFQNEYLEQLVTEKEWLLQEVNHRVKNNLQTIVSLLELQSDTLSGDAHFALQTSQNRIYATSLLYQKLYRTDNVSSVNMQVYITELVHHLRDALGGSTYVSVRLDIAPVEINVSQGVPLGIMINEIITNAFKYAFDESITHPEIMVSLVVNEKVAHLIVKDNGIGLLAIGEENYGIGLKLVKGLAESINGEASIVANNGTVVEIVFEPKMIV